MRKALVLLMVILAITIFSLAVMAGSGDENYNGEDGEQPAPGAETSPGEGLPSDAPDTGDRTRFKDA